jgi:hypothetical protein
MAGLVGLALLVVLDKVEFCRTACFVLHDLFDLSFDEIAPIVGRASKGTRQLGTLSASSLKIRNSFKWLIMRGIEANNSLRFSFKFSKDFRMSQNLGWRRFQP